MTTEAVVMQATTAEAEERANRIRAGMAEIAPLIFMAWKARDWQALGHKDWNAYVDAEFGGTPRLPVEQRRELVTEFASEGMSTRAIGKALGVSQPLVVSDLQVIRTDHLAPVTGLDGKTYTRPERAVEAAPIEQTADSRQEPAEEDENHLSQPSPEEIEANFNAIWHEDVRRHIESIERLTPGLHMSQALYRKRRQIIRHLLASYAEWCRQNGFT